MAGKHRKPVKPIWPMATGAALAVVSLLTTTSASYPPVQKVAQAAPLEPVHFAFPPLSTAEAALYLPPLPATPASAVEPAPVVHGVAEAVKAPERVISAATQAVSAAVSRKGTPYIFGGAAPGGFDCSGLVQWAFKQAGISLPRTAAAQAGVGRRIPLSDLQPGDLLYFYQPIDHVVMYIGNGQIVEASQPGTTVHVRPMYTQGLVEARRIS